jgi:Fe2+ or Zn2+ uptake regulation protein
VRSSTRQRIADPAEALAGRGLRATRQRVAVLGVLQQRAGHWSALDIHRRLHRAHPSLSQKTVYEILDALVAAGLAARATQGGSPVRYEAKLDRHYHAHCRVCGSLFDLPANADGPIRGRASLPEGFRIDDIDVTLVGRCGRCRDEV